MNATEREAAREMAREPLLRRDGFWRHYGCGNVRGGVCRRCGERLGTRPPAGTTMRYA